jgi:hypothetical protein
VDSKWLAILARAGLLQLSRVLSQPYVDIREISLLYIKVTDDAPDYKNRVQKLFTESGFNLSCVVTEIFGVSG